MGALDTQAAKLQGRVDHSKSFLSLLLDNAKVKEAHGQSYLLSAALIWLYLLTEYVGDGWQRRRKGRDVSFVSRLPPLLWFVMPGQRMDTGTGDVPV